ncbi:MAG: DUF3592 domain-containing protein [Chloroflexi bacterium]|nr:DUF3592 domain-containing protein [Chloroflexota bacterium]
MMSFLNLIRYRLISDPLFWPITLFLGLISCPFLGIGLYEVAETQQLVNKFEATTGVIVDNSYYVSNEDGNRSGAYYPVVEFQPEDSRPVRFTDGIGSLPPDYEVGEQVQVLYDSQDSSEAQISSWKRLWFAPTLITGLGFLPWLFLLIWLMVRGRGLSTPQ